MWAECGTAIPQAAATAIDVPMPESVQNDGISAQMFLGRVLEQLGAAANAGPELPGLSRLAGAAAFCLNQGVPGWCVTASCRRM